MFRINLVLIILLVTPFAVLAEDGEGHSHGGPVVFDPAVAPLVQPDVVDDFVADPADPAEPAPSPFGVSAYTEVTDELSVISLAPRFKVTPWLQAKVRVPWILERKMMYPFPESHEATASGLGDISVDLSYRQTFSGGRQRLDLTGSIKLPTGDDEKMDGDDRVPLGTGSVDLMARGQYALRGNRYGLLASALFRLNSAGGEVIYDYGGGYRDIQTTTNAGQLTGAAFGRYQAADKLWVHLGGAVTMTGDGKQETEYLTPTGSDTDETDLQQGSLLLDVFPGVSYQVGPLQPYLGMRIPVVTSYDSDLLEEERDTAVVFQVSYNPTRFLGD